MATFFSFRALAFVLFSNCLVHCSFSLRWQTRCHDDDHSSLLQLKGSFAFDELYCDPSSYNYTKLSSWNVEDDCCSWDGVDCDVETGHVIRLDLSNSCLYGSMDSSSPLFRLARLLSLDLSYNNFNLSRIPGGIRNLPQLIELNLSYSNFGGRIPSEMLELSSLVSLDLSGNLLMLQKPSLKDVVETLLHLDKLHLSYVTISSPVPQSLSNLTSLSSLLLKNCSLLGEFPPGVFLLPNLRVLSLRYNPNLTGYLPEFGNVSSPLEELWLDGTSLSGQLPISIGNLKSLGVLSAAECRFGGVIPSSVGNLTNLEVLKLSRNYFSGRIPSSLGDLFQLTFLDLSSNNFSSRTLNWVGTLTNLQTLSLSETNTFGVIPSTLKNLTQLIDLLLEVNQLIGQIPSWLGNFTRLTHLSFYGNRLQGPVPVSIFRLPSLESLNVIDNNLSGSLKYDSILQMQHISELQLSFNNLTVVSSPFMNVTLPKFQILGLGRCNLKEIPTFVRGQSELEYLVLEDNNIAGHVPNWLFSLENLILLSLGNNAFTGFEQPLGILSLPNLRILSLISNRFKGPLPFPSLSVVVYEVSHNNFNGPVSPLFCNLTFALRLDFSSNNLSGTLPHCLGNSALVLNLSNNSLSGEIPNEFSSDCKLQVMDFSQNMFEGNLPQSLAKCSELEIINVDKNQINDAFPSWLGVLPRLRILSLRSNQFHGTIGKPLSEFEFGRLQIINLSGNNFRGKLLPEFFRNWVGMKNVDKDRLSYMQAHTSFQVPGYNWTLNYNYSITIMNKGTERAYDQILEFFVVVDLSSNRFEGEIPEIVGTLRALQSLNLSNNMLTGHIPSSLGNLTMLEALDLSQNNLSGQIPSQLTSVYSLEVFNVSHNSLTGPIPRGNQFETFDNSSYSHNPELCGDILSRKCGETETSPPPPSESSEANDEFNWEIVFIGCGTGLVIGIAFGCILDTRKYEWLVKKKFARTYRRGHRN